MRARSALRRNGRRSMRHRRRWRKRCASCPAASRRGGSAGRRACCGTSPAYSIRSIRNAVPGARSAASWRQWPGTCCTPKTSRCRTRSPCRTRGRTPKAAPARCRAAQWGPCRWAPSRRSRTGSACSRARSSAQCAAPGQRPSRQPPQIRRRGRQTHHNAGGFDLHRLGQRQIIDRDGNERRLRGKVFALQLGNAGGAGKTNTATQALQENPAAARTRRQANHGLPALRDNPGALFLRHASSHASGPPHLGNRHVALDRQRPADRPTIPIRHGVRPPESARKRKSAPNPRVLEGCGSRTARSSIKMCKKHDKDQKATQSIQ